MDPELLKLIVVNMPNFIGLIIAVYLLYKIVDRLLPDDDDDDDT